MSRGYDGPEIDDFRHPGWGQEHDRPTLDRSRKRGNDWRPQASVRLKLQELRHAESRSDQVLSESPEQTQSSRSDLSRNEEQPTLLRERARESYVDRDKSYLLRPSEIRTLREVGKFRVVAVDDLAKFIRRGPLADGK